MNNIEEKFYKTFGIEKKKEYGCTDTWEICYHQKEYPNCKGCSFWKLIDIKYPEITDRILLELICILINAEISITFVKGHKETAKETIKNLVLQGCINTTGIKTQVQSLFKGGE